MGRFETNIQSACYQDYQLEEFAAEVATNQLSASVYRETVDEWRSFHSSPETMEQIGFEGLLAMLCDSAVNRGVHVQDAHRLCTNAEMDARFEVA